MLARLAPALLATLAASAACTTDVVVEDGANPVVVTELDRTYQAAADETGVPADLLKAVGYAQTRWQQVIGEAEFDGAVTRTGVMGLTPDNIARGAALTGYAAEDLTASAEANILAAAKLLAEEAAAQGVSGADLAAWEPVLAAWAGIADDEGRRQFVRGDIFRILTEGAEEHAEGGELVASLRPHPEMADLVARPLFAAGPDYAPAVWRASPNFSTRSTGITHVVIHTCEGAYAGCVSTLINGAVSAHYVVNESGSQITQLVRETSKAWHVGATYECSRNGNTDCAKNGVGVNNFAVGIEHAGFGSQASWSSGLLTASAKLTCDITRDRNIPRDRFHIVGHGQLQPYNRTDPGPNWPWAAYLDSVRSYCGDTTSGGGPNPPPPPPPPGTAIVVDSNNANNDSAQARIDVSGWTSSASTAGYYGTGYWYADTGTGSAATFNFYMPAAGTKTIEGWWTAGTNRTASATFIAQNASGAELGRAVVNQQANGRQWVTLGTYAFSAGWNKVVLTRAGASGKVVIADAIRVR
ncbi:MAG: N-acetylmuramoyl-L-alanine amidase [Myxococcales bacterium]|nr:N-acetylmuramoyl-L-alanine amidase [Myxococcales bacterium]